MTTVQLHQLLEQMPQAARLVNSDGETVAQNVAAQQHQPSSEQSVSEHQIGDDWRLETWKAFSAADPDLRALANGLAHTLRNPLSSIMTAADLVKDDPGVSEESAMLLGIVAKESRQLNRILTDFLTYVRPRPNTPEAFDLAHTLRFVVEDLKRKNLIPAGIRVLDELPVSLLVWGDENAIRHSLCHVVLNAVEAMNGRGVLRLAGETIDGHKKVHVEDDGPGFSDESLKRAFEPFYSDRPENAGLGLSMAMASIERAGGRLTIGNVDTQNGAKSSDAHDIEYSMSDTTAQPVTKGARVCIELRSPTKDDHATPPPIDEVITV